MPDPIDPNPQVEHAMERTLLAWVRTALAIMGLGFVVSRFGLFLREMEAARGVPAHSSGGASSLFGVLLMLLGVAALLTAATRFASQIRRHRRGHPAPLSLLPGLALTLSLSTLGLALAVYLLVTSR